MVQVEAEVEGRHPDDRGPRSASRRSKRVVGMARKCRRAGIRAAPRPSRAGRRPTSSPRQWGRVRRPCPTAPPSADQVFTFADLKRGDGRRRARRARATSSPASAPRPPRSAWPRATRWPTCRCKPFLDEALIPTRERRGHAADRRHPRRGGLRAGRAPDRRRLPRLAAVRRARRPSALAALAPGLTPEMAAAVSQADAQPGPDRGREEVPRRHALPQHHRPARPPVGAAAAEPPDRRPARHRRLASLDGLLYGCGDAVIGINPATDSMPVLAQLLRLLDDLIRRFDDPDAGLRADPRDQHAAARSSAARRSTWCSSRSPAREAANARFGITLGAARRGARGGARR